ncbi:MAG: ATP-binding protein [Acetobacterium sp.]
MILLIPLVNQFFFYSYYLNQNESRIQKAVEELEIEIEKGNQQSGVNQFVKETGAKIRIYNPDSIEVIRDKIGIDINLLSEEQIAAFREKAGMNQGGVFETTDKSGILEQQLVYYKLLSDQSLMVVTRSMGFIGEATKMSNAFTVRAAIGIYLLGLILIIFLSKFISKPITNITRVAKKMAKMDFNEKLQCESKDELGELSKIINDLADKLANNIEALKLSNDHLELELNKERSMEAMRRQFISDVSHELKNPISVIMAYGNGLIEEIPDSLSDKQEYYQVIVEEAEMMHVLVSDLLELSALESGMVKTHFEKVNVNQMVNQALVNFQEITKEKALSVDVEMMESIEIDSEQIKFHQLLINLMENAFKYCDHEGKVRIELSEDKTNIQLLVANTGNLISPEYLDKIWQSFYQVDPGTEGNGLGLAIVKSIVALHHGKIRVYTTDSMNCFEVVIPKYH